MIGIFTFFFEMLKKNRMAALATPLSPLSFEAAMAMGQTGRFLSPTARPRHQSKPSDILNQNQDEEDWC